MNRIEKTTESLKSRKVLAGYFMAGEFSEEQTLKIMHTGVSSGLDILEIGFPFSDPTADGGTIQISAVRSLKNGTKIDDVFSLIAKFRKENFKTPVILMGYYNVVFQLGEENFLKRCSESGVDGLIIVDLPIEESQTFQILAKKYNVILIQIVSFLTNKERFKQIEEQARGFVYLVSTLGVTGQALPMMDRIGKYIKENNPKLPIFVGFGISSAQTAKEIAQHANGIVVGSHFIQSARKDDSLNELANAVKEIKNAINDL